jgi:hypothetical protein
MIDAVIVGAKKVDAWNPQSGTWEVGMALRLYESVRPLFEYPTNAGYPIRRNEHISWRTVYNLYLNKKKKFVTVLGDAMADDDETDLGDAMADDDETGVAVGGVNELMEE